MTLKEIAKQTGLNYHTARKYSLALKERGIELSEETAPILQKIASLTRDGKTVEQAIDEILKSPEKSGEQSFSDVLMRLEAKIDELQKNSRTQDSLIQVYLSRINNLEEYIRALPPPRDSKELGDLIQEHTEKLDAVEERLQETIAKRDYLVRTGRFFKRGPSTVKSWLVRAKERISRKKNTPESEE